MIGLTIIIFHGNGFYGVSIIGYWHRKHSNLQCNVQVIWLFFKKKYITFLMYIR